MIRTMFFILIFSLSSYSWAKCKNLNSSEQLVCLEERIRILEEKLENGFIAVEYRPLESFPPPLVKSYGSWRGLEFDLISCKKHFSRLNCQFKVKNKNTQHINTHVLSHSTFFIDEHGYQRSPEKIKFVEEIGSSVSKLLIVNLPVDLQISFPHIPDNVSRIMYMSVGVAADPFGGGKVEFSNVAISDAN